MMFLSQDHSTSEQANSPDRPHAMFSATLRAVQCVWSGLAIVLLWASLSSSVQLVS